MLKKFIYIGITALLIAFQTNAQSKQRNAGLNSSSGSNTSQDEDPDGISQNKTEDKKNKPKVPSRIKSWSLHDQGSLLKITPLDTTLSFFHNYIPFNKNSISSTFTGNNGGAYISNDFFQRNSNSDFYFNRSFDA